MQGYPFFRIRTLIQLSTQIIKNMFKKLLPIIFALCLGASGLKAQCPANAGPDQTICFGATVTLAATPPISGYTGTWTRTGGTTPTATITTPTSATSTVTNISAAGTITLVWTITGAVTCTDTVKIIVQGVPTANAGTDRSICVGGTASLNASAIPTGSVGTWTKLGGVNVATTVITTPTSRTSTVTGFPIGTTGTGPKDTLKWTVNNAACPTLTATDLVVITVNAAPSPAPNAGFDQIACQGDTVKIIGNTPGTGGTPSFVFPAGLAYSNFIASTAKLISTVGGKINVVYRIANGTTTGANPVATTLNGCLLTDTVAITFNPTNANAGTDIAVCTSQTSVTLAATPVGANEAGTWSFITKKGSEVITSPNSPTSTVTGITSDTLKLRWTVTGSGCTDTDDVLVIISKEPTVADAGPPTRSGCVGDTLLLLGTNPIVGKPIWTLGSGVLTSSIAYVPNNAASFSNDTARLRLRAPGTYKIYYTIAVGPPSNTTNPCTSRDSVMITVNALPTANAGINQSSCDGSMKTFTVLGNKPTGSGIWSIIAPGAGNVTTTTDTVGTVTGLAIGVTTLKWTVVSAEGCKASDNMTITEGPVPVANAGTDQTGCMNDTLKLFGTIATIGSPAWSYGTTTPPSDATHLSFVSTPNNDTVRTRLLIAGTYKLVYSISLGSCITRDTVAISILAAPTANAGLDKAFCAGGNTSTSVGGNRPPSGTTGVWSVVSGPGAVTTTDTIGTVTGLTPGVTTLRWTLTNAAGCKGTDNMTISTGPVLTADAKADQSGCVGDTLLLVGNNPTIGTATWSRGTGTTNANIGFVPLVIGTPTNTNNDSIRARLRTAGTYTMIYTLTLGTCPASKDSMTFTVNAAPTLALAGADITANCGDTVSLTGNVPLVGTPNWKTSDPVLASFTGSSAVSAVKVKLAKAAGTANMTYTISNGTTKACVSSDVLILTSLCNTGIFNNGGNALNISLHPNPAKDVFYLSFKEANVASAELTILTLDGRAVYTENLGSVKEISKEFTISNLAKGIYFVKINFGETTSFKKLVIQ
jgi:hypothetical protein